MSFSARINSYEASVKRLEGQVTKMRGYYRPLCRLVGRGWWASPKRPQSGSEHVLEAVCWYCHSKYDVDLSWNTEDERKAWRLYYSFTLEDQYTNPVAHAVSLWLKYRQKQRKGIAQRQRATPHGSAKGRTKWQRLLAQLREEIGVLNEGERKRLFDKYGGPPFPNHQDLIEAGRAKATIKRKTSGHVNGLYALEEEITNYMICAELEKIIWGESLAETSDVIEKLEREIDELVRAAEAKKATAAAVEAMNLKATRQAASEVEPASAEAEQKAEAEKSGSPIESRPRRARLYTREDSIRDYAARAQQAPRDNEYYRQANLRSIRNSARVLKPTVSK
jgi:hypothetical protein